MRSSRNFSRCAVLFLAGLLGMSGCTHPAATLREPAFVPGQVVRVAVLPPANLSGTQAPLKELRQMLNEELLARDIPVLGEEDTYKFMARHRLRNTGDIDSQTGRSLKTETGADSVLVTSLILYNETYPPKVTLWARLVATGEEQTILWMDGRGPAGDDHPGLLGLGLIRDPRILLRKAVQGLVDSLARSLSRGEVAAVPSGRRYRPTTAYRSPVFEPGRRYRVAVVPFYDLSGRKNADKIVDLQFTDALVQFNNFDVIEPGLVREKLLNFRMIMDHGVSLAQAETLFDVLDCDLILAGSVFRYEDYQGPQGAPAVELSVRLLERKSREVVWSSRSSNSGDDGVYFFDIGKVSTAQTLAGRMARSLLEQLTEE